MKGRARPPSSPESEESWTVECPCGVNFDDGEEMVDCDECGVWVHTSCCRVLKGRTSYVCDKCKLKKKKESEESEVAQLLIELPSKTPHFEEKTSERSQLYPFRTALSIEERAHVHGIPGGDPEFFAGVSPVFSRQLWKCTGYVPKVLGFKYKELPECKDTTRVLFADCIEEPENMRHEHKPEDARIVEGEMQQVVDTQTENNQLPKERHPKRELRKDSKYRQSTQEDKVLHQANRGRRRDDGAKKESTSRKRSRNMTDTHQGCQDSSKREDIVVPLRSSRIASKNPKAMRKLPVETFSDDRVEDAKVANDRSLKAELRCGGQEPESPGFLLKAGGFPAHSSALDYPKSPDFCKLVDFRTDVEVLVQREHSNDGGRTELKNTMKDSPRGLAGDSKEALQRLKLNIVVNAKHPSEEGAADELWDPDNARLQPGNHANDKAVDGSPEEQKKQSAALDTHQSRSVQFSDRNQTKAIRDSHLRQDLSADALQHSDSECAGSRAALTVRSVEDDGLVSTDEQGKALLSPKASSLSTHVGVMKSSPPYGNVVLAQPIPPSKTAPSSSGLPNIRSSSLGAKVGNPPTNTFFKSSSSSVKHRPKTSNTSDIKKTSPSDGHSNEQSISSSRHPGRDLKEPTKVFEHTAGKGAVPGAFDRHPLPSDSTAPPVLNDEELALLLHQELNSSPRVGRVARVRQSGATPHPLSSKRPAGASTPTFAAGQKEHYSIFKRKASGEGSHALDDLKVEPLENLKHDDVGKEKDLLDGSSAQKPTALFTPDATRHLSPGPPLVARAESPCDFLGAYAFTDGERRALSSENILTLPGLIEEILHEKGHQASYDYICDEVLPHWPKLRKHNGEPYAYTSHRQAVLDCLRNRSAWSHLIDRGPKVMRANLGRKRRRADFTGAVADSADQSPLAHDDEGDDPRPGRCSKDEMDGNEGWPPSEQGKDIDVALPEEVPKGKRKARRGRRLAKGYGAKNHQNHEDRTTDLATGSEDDQEQVLSPLSEDATSTYSEEDEISVHRSSRRLSRRRGSSIDTGDDDIDF